MKTFKPTAEGSRDVYHRTGESHEELLAGFYELGDYEGEKYDDGREDESKTEYEAYRTLKLTRDLAVLACKLAEELILKELERHVYDKSYRKAESQRHENVCYLFCSTENDAKIGDGHEEEHRREDHAHHLQIVMITLLE